ncbi:MAG: squalene/phytoene synthase family protein [Bacteroidia bacterium]|nr:squalene/phytoene synthase family protein [Bacteroidia bacterium]
MDPTKQQYFDILNRIPIERISDHPNILVAAGFWDEERYQAAKTCYSFMRKIDDLIDNYKARHKHIGENDREKLLMKVEDWLRMIRTNRRTYPFQKELISTMERFRIPVWTIENFARSMVYDINNDGFPTLRAFLDYSEGATVAPSSIFVHLCGISKNDRIWQDPPFDVKSASTPCAIFSYLVHIIRDFRKDQLNNLSYFADDRMVANDLTRQLMKQIAAGAAITPGFRNLMKEYYLLADDYRKQTWQVLEQIGPLVEPRYHLSLLIIFNLYLMVFERIDIDQGNFMAAELNPSPLEIHNRVYRTIQEFQDHSVNY